MPAAMPSARASMSVFRSGKVGIVRLLGKVAANMPRFELGGGAKWRFHAQILTICAQILGVPVQELGVSAQELRVLARVSRIRDQR